MKRGATSGAWVRRVEHWMPGVRALRVYERAWLSRDLIAGVVLVTAGGGERLTRYPKELLVVG